jgi:hypothetical protein
MPTHQVEEGEQLIDIAAKSGFENVETIWNAPENAELRGTREDPSQVSAGDSVFIPEKRVATFEKPASGVHEFEVHVAKLEVTLRLLDLFGNPLDSAACTLRVDGEESSSTTDGDGMLRVRVKRDARSAVVVVGQDTYNLAVGALAPLPTALGVEGRLLNLGYLDAPLQGVDSAEQLAAALEQFQADHGLKVDGILNDEVVDALSAAHGI